VAISGIKTASPDALAAMTQDDVLSRPFPTRLNVKFLLFLPGKNERNWELVQHGTRRRTTGRRRK
jgi:hypothetical protein